MFLSKISVENFRCFGENTSRFELFLRRGLTALVGENDAGKSAVIDALRFALGTADQERPWLEDTDFHESGGTRAPEIRITCRFEDLTESDMRAFVEFLTYSKEPGKSPVLNIHWTALYTGAEKRGRSYRRIEVHSGENGNGPSIPQEVRDMLQTTYLRPLRDADHALSAGRGSRLSQVLRQSGLLAIGQHTYDGSKPLTGQRLSMLEIANLINKLLETQEGIVDARKRITEHLASLCLAGDNLTSDIKVGGAMEEEARIRQLLEKLDLSLAGTGNLGLGSDNLLFMACELLLLDEVKEGNKMLLIEEPEAHLHAQRQLRVMRFLQDQAMQKGIQIIVTTHSANLASVIKLDNVVMIHNKHAYSMAEGETNLEPSDYRFLERFLDVTKANLFFARGVMIVEGDAENILLPTLARLLGRDFTKHGVSIVNVGGVGLRRYARIFQRKSPDKAGKITIPVACVTDMDVMPDCAPSITGKVDQDTDWPKAPDRRWKAKSDFKDEKELARYRREKELKASAQYVETFVSDEWTLEYDLALGPRDRTQNFSDGLAEEVYIAASLAKEDDAINTRKKSVEEVEIKAKQAFSKMRSGLEPRNKCKKEEVLASMVYAKVTESGVSKTVVAQYLAERLEKKHNNEQEYWKRVLPKYLVEAIDYVTGAKGKPEIPETETGPKDV